MRVEYVFILLLSGGLRAAAGEQVHRPPAHHEVRMPGSRFAPARLVIAPGDDVTFRLLSGGPHNVMFWPDSIPPGAAAVLRAAMTDTIADLGGPLLIVPDQTYTVSFAGVPAGEYHYYCLPHLTAMKGVIVVEEPHKEVQAWTKPANIWAGRGHDRSGRDSPWEHPTTHLGAGHGVGYTP